MKTITKIALALALGLTPIANAEAKRENVEYNQSNKTASIFCSNNEECIDVVAMELDAMYYQGVNETNQHTMGTLINRKDRSLADYCNHAKDKKSCETYKNQLMLKYMTGLLDR